MTAIPPATSAAYAALVRARKSCRACTGLINPAVCDGGTRDSDQIGPWSLWQGNLNADLVIVGQDWGDTRYFIANGGHEAARRFDIGFDWFNRTFDIEKKPLQSIGLVASALVAIAYWAAVIVSRVVG